MIEINSYFAKTHQGPYLNLNEDDVYINIEYKLFCLFDGIGGSGIGDKATALVKSRLEEFFAKVSHDPDATMPYYFNPSYVIETNALINALHIAHKALLEQNSQKEMSDRGAVSCSLVIFSENICSIVSIGNCATYLYRNSAVNCVGTPDCITPSGTIEQNQGLRTFPLAAIGLFDELPLKIWEINAMPRDKFIILSDGVYSRISTTDIKSCIEESQGDEFESIGQLIQKSNDRGNLDNQSAIIISI